MSTELERVREKLYERGSITLTDVFERLVREEAQRQTIEAAIRLLCPYCEYDMPAYPLNEVQTANGKPFWHQDQFDHSLYHECKAAAIRALLSPSQEVRNG